MAELFFLVAFAMTLLVTGLNKRGLIMGLVIGLGVMIVTGLLAMVYKLLPWVLLIAGVIWLLKSESNGAKRLRSYGQNYVERVRNTRH